jgi:acetate kinase
MEPGTRDMSNGFVLTINAGSSSLKFALFRTGKPPQRILAGKFDRIGLRGGKLIIKDLERGKQTERDFDAANHIACVSALEELLERKASLQRVRAVGHRIVHGGPRYTSPQVVDDDLLEELRKIRSFDPDHMPAELGLVRHFTQAFHGIPQIACFDTAFHRDLPRVARLLPIPRRYHSQGVQRYGFHGLSYGYLMGELKRIAGPRAARGRLILAHLGNGASMAAVHQGRSVDTTMAFTPAAGLVMSSRSGDLDPGLCAYFARSEGMTAPQFNDMVNTKSGLLGISETSSDVRDLLEREKKDDRAADALDLFCYQAAKNIGALACALRGLDTLVFAGGIGENSTAIRSRICHYLKFLGLELDPRLNHKAGAVISHKSSRIVVRIIKTDEELYMANILCSLLARLRTDRKPSPRRKRT